MHRSALPRAHARFFEIRRHYAGPDPLTDELDHIEKPALGQWSCRSLLGLPSSPQHVSGRVARAEPVGLFDLTVQESRNSLVGSKHGQNIVGKRTGGRSAPTTVNSSVRPREYLTTAEIERLMAAARKSSRYGQREIDVRLLAAD